MLQRLKKMAAIVLAACLFLPLSQCEVAPQPQDAVADAQTPQKTISTLTPVAGVKLAEPQTWLVLLAFLWPLAVVLAVGRNSQPLWLALVEPVLASGTLYVVWLYAMSFGEPLWGGVAAVTAAGILLLVTLVSAGGRIRSLCNGPNKQPKPTP